MTTGVLPSAPPRQLAVLVGAVIGAGGAAIVHSLLRLPEIADPTAWVVLTAMAIVAASFALKVPGVPVYLSISDAFFIATGLLLGPAPAALTIALDSLIVSVRRRNTVRQLLFNVTSPALALWCGVHAYFALSGTTPLAGGTAPLGERSILPLATLAAVYFLLNSGFTATAVAGSKGLSPLRFWRDHFAVMSVNYFAAASAAFFLLILVRVVGLAALAAIMPLVLVCHLAMRSWLGRVDDAQRHLGDMNRLYLSTISAFSTAIEAKDGVTSDHIHRVQAYATGLARALGVTDVGTLRAIEAAALLHDTGKLAIPEHILNKPGKLTAQEFETMKAHVDIGADILATIDFPYPVVPIVRAHHENWNGSGYPRGLKGEDIPIGARILSVVDCFDALTSDRPYRPAMSDTAALEIIVQSRGVMYDPLVVDTFVRVQREIAPASLPQPRLDAILSTFRGANAAVPAAGLAAAPMPAAAGSDASSELLAFVSLARLANGSPTFTDLGALAEGPLRRIAPDATVALFGLDAAGGAVSAQYVAGPEAAAVAGLAIRLGERLSGWSAATLQSVANSDARLDLADRTPAGLRVACASPLVHDGVALGVLTLYAPAPLAGDQCRMLDMVAPHLATAMAPVVAAAKAAPAMSPRSRLRIAAAR
ncbi:MAG: HD domain-containing phosphohydrolase [Vicinamibacterales bacterium]